MARGPNGSGETYPLGEVALDVDSISHDLAARLVFRLVQDLMFLKGQIPL